MGTSPRGGYDRGPVRWLDVHAPLDRTELWPGQIGCVKLDPSNIEQGLAWIAQFRARESADGTPPPSVLVVFESADKPTLERERIRIQITSAGATLFEIRSGDDAEAAIGAAFDERRWQTVTGSNPPRHPTMIRQNRAAYFEGKPLTAGELSALGGDIQFHQVDASNLRATHQSSGLAKAAAAVGWVVGSVRRLF